MTYPITITRDAIVALDPCEDGLALFDGHYPSGVFVVADVYGHMALYSGPLAKHVEWAESGGLLPRVCAQGGDFSTLTGGDFSTLTGGYRSTLTGGDSSTLTGGDFSTLTGGYRSTLTGGYRSTLTGGYRSTLTGGDFSTLTWRYWDGTHYRLHTVYTGEDGIKPNTPYIGRFVDGVFTLSEVTA